MTNEFDDIVGTDVRSPWPEIKMEIVRVKPGPKRLRDDWGVKQDKDGTITLYKIEPKTLNFTVDDHGIAHLEAEDSTLPVDELDEFFGLTGTDVRPRMLSDDSLPVCHNECIGRLSCKYGR